MKELLNYFNGDELASDVWLSKYAIDGERTPDDMHKRLAKEFYRIESKYIHRRVEDKCEGLSDHYNHRCHLTENDIYELFRNFKYIIPGGSVMAGVGSNNLISLSNCFVIDSPKDSYSDIMKTRNNQVQLMKRRGGVGYDLSKLRPRGTKVNNAAGVSSGAASFMDVCSDITKEVAQGGRRKMLLN